MPEAGSRRFVFRVDASAGIGGGHVMRCLTLAKELRARSAHVHFVCRELEGNLCSLVEHDGFMLTRLPAPVPGDPRSGGLGATWQDDAAETAAAVRAAGPRPDWLVVDHYSIGSPWESAMRAAAGRILVIDDVGRSHHCDLLLDQNMENPAHGRYGSLLPRSAKQLLGPSYALVRPEFGALRTASLERRQAPVLERVLVFMGSSDVRDETTKALDGMAGLDRGLAAVDIVIGAANPHRSRLEERCAASRGMELFVQTPRMAELMARADLAICAAGSTTWERCVLGLPGLAVIQADNEAEIAAAVAATGAQKLLGLPQRLRPQDYRDAVERIGSHDLARMSEAAARLCDGRGASRVADELLG